MKEQKVNCKLEMDQYDFASPSKAIAVFVLEALISKIKYK